MLLKVIFLFVAALTLGANELAFAQDNKSFTCAASDGVRKLYATKVFLENPPEYVRRKFDLNNVEIVINFTAAKLKCETVYDNPVGLFSCKGYAYNVVNSAFLISAGIRFNEQGDTSIVYSGYRNGEWSCINHY